MANNMTVTRIGRTGRQKIKIEGEICKIRSKQSSEIEQGEEDIKGQSPSHPASHGVTVKDIQKQEKKNAQIQKIVVIILKKLARNMPRKD